MKSRLVVSFWLLVVSCMLLVVPMASAEKMWNFNNHTVNISDDLYFGGNLYGDGSGLSGLETNWNVSGSYLFPRDLNFNLGIGTDSPGAKLDVEGNGGVIGKFTQNSAWTGSEYALSVSGYTNLNGFRINAADGIRGLFKTASGGSLGFATAGDDPITFTQSSTQERMRIATGGNVGIGTTDPGRLLTVNGALRAQRLDVTSQYIDIETGEANYGRIRFFSASGNQKGAEIGNYISDGGTPGVNNYIDFKTGELSTPDTRMRIDYEGDVGIGTTSPSGTLKLDVEGQVGATEYCDETGANCVDISNVMGAGADNWVNESGDTMTGELKIDVGGGNNNGLYINGDMRFGPDYSGGQTGLFKYNTAIDGLIIDTWGSAKETRIGGSKVILGVGEGGQLGNVGVGTTSPNAVLHVMSPYARTDTSDRIFSLQTSNDADYRIGLKTSFIGGATASGRTTILQSGAYDVSGSSFGNTGERLALNPNGGNVGIGTTSPDSLLHLYDGDSTATPYVNSNLIIENSAGSFINLLSPNTQVQGIMFGDPENALSGYIRYSHIDDSMKLSTAGSERLTIDQDGNVGIGDTTPDGTLKLDVEGQVGATEYCDETGNNCVDIANVAVGSDYLALAGGTMAGAIDMGNNAITNINWAGSDDGSGSGLDADLWDGNQFATYLNQALLTTSAPTFATLNTGSGAMDLGDAAVANGDTNSIPTGDQVYDFVIGLGYTNDMTAAEMLTAIKTVDGSGSGLDADLLDGIDSTRYIYGTTEAGSTQAATVEDLTERAMYKAGFWDANGASWTPDTGWWWGSTLAHTSNSNSYLYGAQLVFENSLTPQMYIRGMNGGATPATGSWQKVWTDYSDGTGSGLDADLWDGNEFASYLNQALLTTSAPTFATINTGSGAMDLGDAAVANGDTNSIPTGDQVYDFVIGQGYINSLSGAILDGTPGNWEVASNSLDDLYTSASLELREYNNGGAQTGAYTEAPSLSFHWSGRVASQIMMGTSGDIEIRDNPGTGYETLRARDYKVGATAIIDGSRNLVNVLTLDTGQGANELYDMNQNVQTTDAPTFATINTGSGAMDLGDAAVANGDTNSIPTGDQVYDFVDSFMNPGGAGDIFVEKAGDTMTGTLYTSVIEDSATNIGKTSTAYTTITTGNWAKPVGYSIMSKSDSTGLPSGATYGYWNVLGRRDSGGGYVGLYVNNYQDAGSGLFVGRSSTTADPTWEEVWTDLTDGTGSGLDADLLDGVANTDDYVMVGSGSAWEGKAIPDCTTGKLLYTASTNTFSCGTDANAGGDITGITTAAGTSGLNGGCTSGTCTLTFDATDVDGLGLSGSGATLNIGYLPATDDRDIKPNVMTIADKQVKAYFTSLEGLTGSSGSNYQDFLVLDTYQDGSGGDSNALAFDKSTKEIRHYQADQTATSWGTPETLAYQSWVTSQGYGSGDGTVTGVTGTAPIASSGGTAPAISITGNGITDTHLAYDTGQHLTTGSSPSFSTLNAAAGAFSGNVTADGLNANPSTDIVIDSTTGTGNVRIIIG